MAAGMVVFLALLVLGVVGLIRYLGRMDRSLATRPVAEQVLAERFARGDIDEPEYRQCLDVLREGVSTASQAVPPTLRSAPIVRGHVGVANGVPTPDPPPGALVRS
jgi:putative membrane protein